MGVEGAGKARRGRVVATASIRYPDETVRQVDWANVRLSVFAGSVPWRKVRSMHGQPHYSGSDEHGGSFEGVTSAT
jgi:hypothetical protein